MQHAPQGPRIANPSPANDLLPVRSVNRKFTGPKCSARSKRTGNPCGQPAMMGCTVCKMHGGKAPQVMAKAKERLMALQPMAIQTLHNLMGREEFPTVQLGAAKDVLDRTEGRATETIDMNVSGDMQLITRLQSARKRIEAKDGE